MSDLGATFLRFLVQLAFILWAQFNIFANAQAGTLSNQQLNQNIIELYRAGRYEEALPLAEQAVETLRAGSHDTAMALATLLSWKATLHVAQGNYVKAAPLYEDVLRVMEQALGRSHPALGVGLDTLGLVYLKQEGANDLQPLFRRAIEIKESSLANNVAQSSEARPLLEALIEAQDIMIRLKPHEIYGYEWEQELLADGATEVDLSASSNNLAVSMHGPDITEARSLSRRALGLVQKQRGQNLVQIPYLNNLAHLYCIPDEKADFSECENILRQALGLRQALLGPWNLAVAESYERIAYCFLQQHKTAEVTLMYNSVLAVHEKVLGAQTSAYANRLEAVAEHFKLISNGGKNLPVYAEAETLLKRAVTIREKITGADADIATSYYKLGMNAFLWQRYPEAEVYFQRALTIREGVSGKEHPDLVETLVWLAWSLKAQKGGPPKAVQILLRALSVREKALGAEHRDVADILGTLAELYDVLERGEQAVALLNRAQAILERSLGPDSLDLAKELSSLARSHYRRHRYREAEALYKKALAIQERGLPPGHFDVPLTLWELGGVYLGQERYQEAEQPLRSALI